MEIYAITYRYDRMSKIQKAQVVIDSNSDNTVPACWTLSEPTTSGAPTAARSLIEHFTELVTFFTATDQRN